MLIAHLPLVPSEVDDPLDRLDAASIRRRMQLGDPAVTPIMKRMAGLVPVELRLRVIRTGLRLREELVRRRFERATPAEPLGIEDLRALCDEFPVTPNRYGRSSEDYRVRGEERRQEVSRYLESPAKVLEIGAGDGMACRALQLAGYESFLVDIDITEVDARVHESGVRVLQMDATHLAFADAAFDGVFSFNAFEHLPRPDATFAEMARILRPGGIGFISFSALANSPHGGHLYNVIGVPYVSLLCTSESIDEYRRERGLDMYVPWINGWPIERFRDVFASADQEIETLHYQETRNLFHLGLVDRFLPQLRRSPSWDSLVVDSVRFVFRKRR